MLMARLGGTEVRPLSHSTGRRSLHPGTVLPVLRQVPVQGVAPDKIEIDLVAANSLSCGERVPIMTVTPGPPRLLRPDGGPLRQLLPSGKRTKSRWCGRPPSR